MGSGMAPSPRQVSSAKPWAPRPALLNERKDCSSQPEFARDDRFSGLLNPRSGSQGDRTGQDRRKDKRPRFCCSCSHRFSWRRFLCATSCRRRRPYKFLRPLSPATGMGFVPGGWKNGQGICRMSCRCRCSRDFRPGSLTRRWGACRPPCARHGSRRRWRGIQKAQAHQPSTSFPAFARLFTPPRRGRHDRSIVGEPQYRYNSRRKSTARRKIHRKKIVVGSCRISTIKFYHLVQFGLHA